MTEKRFECGKGSRIIIDNETKLHYIMTLDWECSLITKLLNHFAEENEQLKIRFKEERDTAMRLGSQCDALMIQNHELKKENEELKQFKQNVFGLIDKKLQENDDNDEYARKVKIDLIMELKKELEE